MSKVSEPRCDSAYCIEVIAKYGEQYHRVHQSADYNGGLPICESCGGKYIDGKWIRKCRKCGKEEPRRLSGLFVPHSCTECEQAQADSDIASGNVCRMCRAPRSRCCC